MIIRFDTKGEITLDDIIETLKWERDGAHDVVSTRSSIQSAEFQGRELGYGRALQLLERLKAQENGGQAPAIVPETTALPFVLFWEPEKKVVGPFGSEDKAVTHLKKTEVGLKDLSSRYFAYDTWSPDLCHIRIHVLPLQPPTRR